jgi:hypothetical protein
MIDAEAASILLFQRGLPPPFSLTDATFPLRLSP